LQNSKNIFFFTFFNVIPGGKRSMQYENSAVNKNSALEESNRTSHGGGMQNINCRMKIAVM
jgi:hypothetical protein